MPCDAVAAAVCDDSGMGKAVGVGLSVDSWPSCVMYGCWYSEAVYAVVGTSM